MLHNPKLILQIEKWAKIFAWLNLAMLAFYLIALGMLVAAGKTFYLANNIPINYSDGIQYYHAGFWDKGLEVIKYLIQGIAILANVVFLLGASKAVRFFRLYYAQISGGDATQ